MKPPPTVKFVSRPVIKPPSSPPHPQKKKLPPIRQRQTPHPLGAVVKGGAEVAVGEGEIDRKIMVQEAKMHPRALMKNLPMTMRVPGRKTPEGTWCSAYDLPSNTTV